MLQWDWTLKWNTEFWNDIALKLYSNEEEILSVVSAQKYPNISKVSMYVQSFFPSTYVCESEFSTVNIIK
jgi:hypothetical protein